MSDERRSFGRQTKKTVDAFVEKSTESCLIRDDQVGLTDLLLVSIPRIHECTHSQDEWMLKDMADARHLSLRDKRPMDSERSARPSTKGARSKILLPELIHGTQPMP